MGKRFVTIWLPHLKTDRFARSNTALKAIPFALALPDHGRMVVTEVNALAQAKGIYAGMVVADARALLHGLQVLDDKPGLAEKILHGLAEWCIRYTPVVAIDLPEGLVFEATGCAHLWGDETKYLRDITNRLHKLGYTVQAAISDTVGCAWAMSRYSRGMSIVATGEQMDTLLPLPAAALRLEPGLTERLQKLGLRQVKDFIGMPRQSLQRRFGPSLLKRLDQALGYEAEFLQPVQPVEPYQERLPCLEPIISLTGIEIALQRLLETVCGRLAKEHKGLRVAVFKGFRTDGKIEKIEISTNHPTHNTTHLFKLFELKFERFEPAMGIEVFVLEAQKVEEVTPVQVKLWQASQGLDDMQLSEMLDRLSTKFGGGHVQRFLPDEHYWPERSVKQAVLLTEQPATPWPAGKQRPVQLLATPEPIEVTAPVPDYPPMNFRYKGKLHTIKRADGPERIEQEWWIEDGQHRDYYCVQDEEGNRYWLFRLGHYDAAKTYGWYLHGFFA